MLWHRPLERSAPPVWHLDCDRSDPETASSSVRSEGPEEAPVTSTGAGTSMRKGGGEENSRLGGGIRAPMSFLKD